MLGILSQFATPTPLNLSFLLHFYVTIFQTSQFLQIFFLKKFQCFVVSTWITNFKKIFEIEPIIVKNQTLFSLLFWGVLSISLGFVFHFAKISKLC